MKIDVVPNKQKPWAVKLAKKVKQFLKKNGFQTVAKGSDATICIGGDGTIYYANYRGRLEGKIIGIGSGSSYVCQATRKNWKKKLLDLLQRKGKKRITLQVKAKKRKFTVISDVVLHAHDYRVVRVFLKIRNKLHSFEGDGIIAATPTGSTGYAYSAGGPKVAANRKSMLLVPICPYKRMFKPMVRKPAKISIWSDRTSDLIIDGMLIGRLRKNEKAIISAGKEKVFA